MIENLECRRFRNRLDAFIDGELTSSERDEMLRHAQSCPECGKLLEEYQSMHNFLAELDQEVEIPPEAAQAWRSAVRDESERSRRGKGNGWVRTLATVAATAIVLLGVTNAYRNGLLPMANTPNVMPESARYDTMDEMDMAEYGSTYNAASSLSGGLVPVDMGAVTGTTRAAFVESDGAADTVGTTAATEDTAARKPVVIYSATRAMQSTGYDDDLTAVDALTAEFEGWCEYRSLSGKSFAEGGSGRSADLELRVPAQRLTEFLDRLAQIGTTIREIDGAEDVSREYYDVQTRLTALRAQYERLTDLITDAADLNDLIALEDKLYEVQYEIDSFEGQLRDMESRANYSQVSVTVSEVREYVEPDKINPSLRERVSEGFADSVEWLKGFLQDMLVAVVAFAPALVVVIPALLVLWLIVHRVRKSRRRARGLK